MFEKRYSLLLASLIALFFVGCGEYNSTKPDVIAEYNAPVYGTIDVHGAKYEGVITKAQITKENDTLFSDKALHVRDNTKVSRSNEKQQDIKQHLMQLIINSKNAKEIPQLRFSNTIKGTCGGDMSIDLDSNNGVMILDSYCEAGVSISGIIDIEFSDLINLNMVFNTLITDKDNSILLKDFHIDTLMLNKNDFSDFDMNIYGLMYHSKYGGVVISTPETLSVYNAQVYDGKLLIQGKNNSYTTLVFDSSIPYIESDYDGDGSIDYVSN